MGYIAIVDYGVGNLKSVSNAMAYVGRNTLITGTAGELERACGRLLTLEAGRPVEGAS